jgi:hypothetical protein
MCIHPAQPTLVKLTRLQEVQHFCLFRNASFRQGVHQAEDLLPVLQSSTRQFTDHKWMAKDLFVVEQGPQTLVLLSEVLDPHGSVHENHRKLPGSLL